MRRKRIAAWLLCAVLALGLLPATVWAAPPEQTHRGDDRGL